MTGLGVVVGGIRLGGWGWCRGVPSVLASRMKNGVSSCHERGLELCITQMFDLQTTLRVKESSRGDAGRRGLSA